MISRHSEHPRHRGTDTRRYYCVAPFPFVVWGSDGLRRWLLRPEQHMTVAIVYATTHGHTGKVADHIADVIRAEGLDVEVAVGGEGRPPIRTCDAVVMAGSGCPRGSHQPELVAFVRRHRHLLQARPSAFVSVSLTTRTRRCARRLAAWSTVSSTGWTPDRTATVAGAFQFSKYSPFQRLVMRLIARQRDRDRFSGRPRTDRLGGGRPVHTAVRQATALITTDPSAVQRAPGSARCRSPAGVTLPRSSPAGVCQ